jgi:hypothetical protein
MVQTEPSDSYWISAYVTQGQREGGEHRPEHVEAVSGFLVTRLRDGAHREQDRERSEREVEEERPAPAGVLDQPASDEWPDGGGDTAEPGPRADRLGAVLVPDGGFDDRQAPRGQQRTGYSLEHPGGDELAWVLSDAAERGREGETHCADDKDPAPAVAIAQAATEEDQRGEREQVAVRDPLQVGQAGVEVLADADERDGDDGAVEHGHARAEDGGDDDAATGSRRELDGRHGRSLASGSDGSRGRYRRSDECDGFVGSRSDEAERDLPRRGAGAPTPGAHGLSRAGAGGAPGDVR